jgi:hypothetical protein
MSSGRDGSDAGPEVLLALHACMRMARERYGHHVMIQPEDTLVRLRQSAIVVASLDEYGRLVAVHMPTVQGAPGYLGLNAEYVHALERLNDPKLLYLGAQAISESIILRRSEEADLARRRTAPPTRPSAVRKSIPLIGRRR